MSAADEWAELNAVLESLPLDDFREEYLRNAEQHDVREAADQLALVEKLAGEFEQTLRDRFVILDRRDMQPVLTNLILRFLWRFAVEGQKWRERTYAEDREDAERG